MIIKKNEILKKLPAIVIYKILFNKLHSEEDKKVIKTLINGKGVRHEILT